MEYEKESYDKRLDEKVADTRRCEHLVGCRCPNGG
jgi:hypothetical protein